MSRRSRMVSFYRFCPVADVDALVHAIRVAAVEHDLLGTVLIAEEGINASVAGAPAALTGWLEQLQALAAIDPQTHLNWSNLGPDDRPFGRLRVRAKGEIVSLGWTPPTEEPPAAGSSASARAPKVRYVDPAQWDELLAAGTTPVLDLRNRYEVALGSFDGAQDPGLDAFREFPQYVSEHLVDTPKVAMFCTGGVRCAKATDLLLAAGVKEVVQLHGGILNYLATVPEAESRWRGDCFVFDDRVTVDASGAGNSREICRHCRMPVAAADREHPDYEAGVSCKHCRSGISAQRLAGNRARVTQERNAARTDESGG